MLFIHKYLAITVVLTTVALFHDNFKKCRNYLNNIMIEN